MNLNCRPGDLAVVVGSVLGNGGLLVRVLHESPGNSLPPKTVFVVHGNKFHVERGEFCWVVEALGSPIKKGSGKAYRICPAADKYLRPIRDPGDDARDESAAWLPPVPTQTKETA
jgi:hypothetical protein